MTDEEITELALAVAANSSGAIDALVLVIRALQAQPGYDHRVFVRTLAALQALTEHRYSNDLQRQSFDATIQRFARSASAAPPGLGDPENR